MNIKKNLPLIAFIILVGLLSLPVMYKVSNKIIDQTRKNNIYSLINKATTLSESNEKIDIYEVKDNKITNIITKEEKAYKDSSEGYIIIKGDKVAVTLKDNNNCTIKDFKDLDLIKTNTCDTLRVANELFTYSDKTIKINDINNIPEIKVNEFENITSTYKIVDNYNNEIIKENIINDGVYKIIYTFSLKEEELFKKEYKLIFKNKVE